MLTQIFLPAWASHSTNSQLLWSSQRSKVQSSMWTTVGISGSAHLTRLLPPQTSLWLCEHLSIRQLFQLPFSGSEFLPISNPHPNLFSHPHILAWPFLITSPAVTILDCHNSFLMGSSLLPSGPFTPLAIADSH